MSLKRNIQPAIRPVELKSIPEAERFCLKNGVPLYIIDAGSEELIRADFVFNAGQINEDFPLVASMTNTMLLDGSINYTSNEINNAFDFYGAFINQSAQKDSAGITVFCLNKHLEKILELCCEILFNPIFPDDELNNLQKKRLQSYLINKQKVQNLANDRFFESIFGANHPYGKQVLPTDFENITRDKLVRFHNDYYAHGDLSIIISGHIHNETKEIFEQYFGKHDCKSGLPDLKDIPIVASKKKRELIEKKDALQSAIRIGSETINKRHNDWPGLLIMDTILGGYFGSRLMKNIREEKGYTYGINSSLMPLHQSGYKVIATEVGKKHTKNTINEIYKEIRLLQTFPVDHSELDVVRNFMAGEMVRMFDGPFALAESFRAVWEFGLGNKFYYKLAEKIKTIGPYEIMYLAKTYYVIDDLYEVIIGSE